MKKRRIAIIMMILVISIVFPLNSFAAEYLNNFEKSNAYSFNQFKDVPYNSWFYDSVKNAYELGIVKGSSGDRFNPAGNITIGESLALASRINSIYKYGNADFVQGTPWYQVYVDFCCKEGIISPTQFSNYAQKATRMQFATIMYAAIPSYELEKINEIEMIPDEKTNSDSVLSLYQAGVLTGNDEYGTFNPADSITRSEVATITTRIIDKSLRKKFTLKTKPLPLEITGAHASFDIIGNFQLYLNVKNTGTSAIDAFEFYSLVYDAYGDPVYYYSYGTNEFRGTWSKAKASALKPGASLTKNYWSYIGFTGVKTIKVAITKVHTVDGNTYKIPESSYKWMTFSW